jgi:glutathione S-transferase
MPMITLYDFSRAPSPRRARILLAEKGIIHQMVQIDMMTAEQMGDAYRAINPNCTIPALELDDGQILTDNAGIAAWAEAAYPNPPLFGVTPIEKAEIASWNAKIEMEGLLSIAEAMRNSSPAMKDRALPGPHNYPQIPALAERGIAKFHAFLDMFDARLAGRDYVATDRFSIADITAAVVIDFAKVVRISPGEQHANLRCWRARMAARPSMSL